MVVVAFSWFLKVRYVVLLSDDGKWAYAAVICPGPLRQALRKCSDFV